MPAVAGDRLVVQGEAACVIANCCAPTVMLPLRTKGEGLAATV
jgi:hypothetical protein